MGGNRAGSFGSCPGPSRAALAAVGDTRYHEALHSIHLLPREADCVAANLGTPSRAVKTPPVIALTTDFGLEDPYVGVMKGVILGICPGARLIDVTHGIPPQDVLAGCLALEAARPYFPKGTIHVAVVDPGVGTDRAILAVRTAEAAFLAPDNGLLSFLAEREIAEIRRIESDRLFLHPVSRTFHGRDVFAPVAGHLAAGVAFEALGPPASRLERLVIPRAERSASGIAGEVLLFDRFGNAVTSIREEDLPAGAKKATVAGRTLPFVATYGSVAVGSPLCLLGSSGRLELSVRGGDARKELGLRRGDRVVVQP